MLPPVAPLAGARIEIDSRFLPDTPPVVAPLAGGLIGIAYKLLSKEKNYNFHNYFFNFTTKKTAVSVWIRWFFCIFLFTGRRRPTGKCPSY